MDPGKKPKRGSPAEVWSGRGEKALRAMDELVASCQQPVIREQVESTALGASDARFVIAQLSSQTAAVEQALDVVEARSAAYDRLVEQRAGLLARLEATVRGLESLNGEIAEVIAIGRTSQVTPDWGGEQRVAELREELAGLREGLAESQRYSEQVLRSQSP